MQLEGLGCTARRYAGLLSRRFTDRFLEGKEFLGQWRSRFQIEDRIERHGLVLFGRPRGGGLGPLGPQNSVQSSAVTWTSLRAGAFAARRETADLLVDTRGRGDCI